MGSQSSSVNIESIVQATTRADLDWKLYARSDRYYVKRFEDETNLRCNLVVDTSRSMGYGSGPYSKSDYARTAAATIAYFLTTQRDAVGLLLFEDQITDYLPARYRPGHLRRLIGALDREPAGQSTNLVEPLEQIAATVRKRGLIVLLSDLLAPAESLRARLGYLRSRGHDVVVLRILDPAEVNFRFTTPAMFHDIESGRDLYIDPAAARESYLRKFAEHAALLERSCVDLGIEYQSITTDRPLDLVLFDLLKERMRRGAIWGEWSGIREEVRNEPPGAVVCPRDIGDRGSAGFSPDPTFAARRSAIQLAHVSFADSSAAHAAQPIGPSSSASATSRCALPAGFRFCPSLSA